MPDRRDIWLSVGVVFVLTCNESRVGRTSYALRIRIANAKENNGDYRAKNRDGSLDQPIPVHRLAAQNRMVHDPHGILLDDFHVLICQDHGSHENLGVHDKILRLCAPHRIRGALEHVALQTQASVRLGHERTLSSDSSDTPA